MKIPTKFKINTEDFKIYFDNKEKTHICESNETGEKTNIGVLGIFLQMGILKILDDKPQVRIDILTKRLDEIEKQLENPLTNVKPLEKKEELKEKLEKEPLIKEARKIEEEPILKKEPKKSEIKERIMEKVLEKTVKKSP